MGRSMSTAKAMFGWAACACVAGLLGGCVIGQVKSSTVQGTLISPETLSLVRPGMPMSDAVALLGEPTSRAALSDGVELSRWTYFRRDKGAGYLFVVFAGADVKETGTTTFVQARNNVIEKVWQEEGASEPKDTSDKSEGKSKGTSRDKSRDTSEDDADNLKQPTASKG